MWSPRERVPWALGDWLFLVEAWVGFDGCFGKHARAFGVSMLHGGCVFESVGERVVEGGRDWVRRCVGLFGLAWLDESVADASDCSDHVALVFEFFAYCCDVDVDCSRGDCDSWSHCACDEVLSVEDSVW